LDALKCGRSTLRSAVVRWSRTVGAIERLGGRVVKLQMTVGDECKTRARPHHIDCTHLKL
jgi:hypothetical protein